MLEINNRKIKHSEIISKLLAVFIFHYNEVLQFICGSQHSF